MASTKPDVYCDENYTIPLDMTSYIMNTLLILPKQADDTTQPEAQPGPLQSSRRGSLLQQLTTEASRRLFSQKISVPDDAARGSESLPGNEINVKKCLRQQTALLFVYSVN